MFQNSTPRTDRVNSNRSDHVNFLDGFWSPLGWAFREVENFYCKIPGSRHNDLRMRNVSKIINFVASDWNARSDTLKGWYVWKILPRNQWWRNLVQSGGQKCTWKSTMLNCCSLNWQLWRDKHWNMTSVTFVSMFKQFISPQQPHLSALRWLEYVNVTSFEI